MADIIDQLAKILAAQPSQQRESKVYGPFGEEYGVDYVDPPPLGAALGARFGFRGIPQAKFPGPWAKESTQAPRPAREWKEPGDDSVGQHIYEALLGRVRQPGEAVAQKGSGGSWLPWLVSGGVGYGVWNALGGPEQWEELKRSMKNDYTPGAPGWEKRQLRNARWDAEGLDRDLAADHGIISRKDRGFSGAVLSAPLTDEQKAAIDRARLPGGVGNAPY